MMDFEIELLNLNKLWEVTGPIWIMGIAALVIGLAGTILINKVPQRMKEIVKVVVMVLVIGGVILAIREASEIWGS